MRLLFSSGQTTGGTYTGEIPLVRSLKRCLEFIDIETTQSLTYESNKQIVYYYKTETKCKNSSISKHTAYLKAVLRYHGFTKHEYLLTKKLKK